jgi:hypothetical protein
MSGGQDIANETNGQGSEGIEVDEGCSRVMKDQAKQREGKTKSTEPSKPDVFIAGATPNKQLKIELPMIIVPLTHSLIFPQRTSSLDPPSTFSKVVCFLRIPSQAPPP